MASSTYGFSGSPVFVTVGTGGTFTITAYGAQGGSGDSGGGGGKGPRKAAPSP